MQNTALASDICTSRVHPAIAAALQHLATVCDYAATHDGKGFSGGDADFGHSLASQVDRLTKQQQIKALAMLRKYQNTQLQAASIELPTDLELTAWLRDLRPEPPVKPDRSIPEVLPGLTPNAQQWQALQEMEAFLGNDEKLYLLTGFAGTGKTAMIQAMVQRLRDKGDGRSIVFTAPTNKATKVLAKMVDRWGLGIDCMTCCKLLGLKPVLDEVTGKQHFKPDYDAENQVENYSLIVIDEASMVGAELWSLLVEAVSLLYCKTKLLFVGDVAQLPPVGERESLCFTEIYAQSNLTEVVRYGGSIGVLAEKIRNRIDYVKLPELETDVNEDRTVGIFVSSLSQWEQVLIQAFKSDRYKQDPDYVRALAYTNKRVNALNAKIRAAIYGQSAPRFVMGERLMASSPVMIRETVVLANSAECEVLEVNEGRSGDWNVWFLGIKTDEGRHKLIEVLHGSDERKFQIKLKELAEAKRWREYWDLKKLFADLNYAYSCTIHKAQGSTFANAFVDVANCMVNQNIRERNQLLYVAFTRASDRLFLGQ